MSRNRAVIYIDKDRFEYYDGTIAAVLDFPYTFETIKDLEVLNPASLRLSIKSFIENHKLTSSLVLIILSSRVCFEKEFTDSADFHYDNELTKFVDNIPFENSTTKVYKMASSSRLIATNTDLYMDIKNSFEESGFLIVAVVPSFVLGGDLVTSGRLRKENMHEILDKFDTVKINSLYLHNDFASKNQGGPGNKKNANKSLKILIPVFIFLIAVLVILVLRR